MLDRVCGCSGCCTHKGFYARVSWGAGGMWLWERSAGSVVLSGPSGSFMGALGGSIADGFVLGGAWRWMSLNKKFDGAPPPASGRAGISMGQLGLFADWFPAPSGPWHLGALAGYSGLVMINGANSTVSGSGFGTTLFTGVDAWIGPDWSIGLMMVASTMTAARLRDSNDRDTGYRFLPAYFGLELTLTAQ